jgi:UDP-N-acetylglucosamine diphosphorylase / glucose-1-phosphate thymidylyltransferase / UDP-N-acetylgalactosamine diphosphorylase / glucosamine-1-phosphate N-acetyltransferase / galactosamine-1-phosphate N-acetyltransferase
MRLILCDRLTPQRINFYPLALGRPVFELRCGMTSLAEKLIAKLGASDVACFVPPYMADVYRAKTNRPVNDPAKLQGDDLMLVSGRVKAAELAVAATGPSQVAVDQKGDVLYARIARADLGKLDTSSIDALLDSAQKSLPAAKQLPATWNYTWDLVLANPAQLVHDFVAAGRTGIEGTVEEPNAIRGSRKDVYIAPGALVHPMVVIDAEHGPVYLDEGVEVHPFTRIEGPCYVGKKSILLGTKCREGNSIGPMCRLGGEVEESIIHGYSNKYHDGFLGHAYVGEWVNLGALSTNSDLKNDYSSVSVILDGKTPISTGSTKVGSLIGDHTKTSIGTLMNTGSYVGAMALIATNGKLLPKFMPSFAWFVEGAVTKGFGKKKVYETAKTAMSRRKCTWTPADEAMWDAVFEMTAPARDEAIRKGRKQLAGG